MLNRPSVIHDLKCWPQYFAPAKLGIKSFEVRRNDRDYKIGDILLLREWNPETQDYIGNKCFFLVTYCLYGDKNRTMGVDEGFVFMAVRVIESKESEEIQL